MGKNEFFQCASGHRICSVRQKSEAHLSHEPLEIPSELHRLQGTFGLIFSVTVSISASFQVVGFPLTM